MYEQCLYRTIFECCCAGKCSGRNSASDAVYEDTQEFMGTYIMVRAYGEHAQDGVEAAFARAKELEQVFSNTIADSEVNQVNTAAKAAVGTDILISADMANVLRAALEYGEKAAVCWTAP